MIVSRFPHVLAGSTLTPGRSSPAGHEMAHNAPFFTTAQRESPPSWHEDFQWAIDKRYGRQMADVSLDGASFHDSYLTFNSAKETPPMVARKSYERKRGTPGCPEADRYMGSKVLGRSLRRSLLEMDGHTAGDGRPKRPQSTLSSTSYAPSARERSDDADDAAGGFLATDGLPIRGPAAGELLRKLAPFDVNYSASGVVRNGSRSGLRSRRREGCGPSRMGSAVPSFSSRTRTSLSASSIL